jgi:flagellar biosynthesis/type III secretory pathway protein FliH
VPIARAVLDAISSLPEEQRQLYLILIERALSDAARKALAMDAHIQKFFTEAHQQSYDRGKSEGKSEGKAEDLVKILRRRGMVLTDEQQQQICACTDLATLDRWLDRAFSATSVDEVLAKSL